MSVLQKAMFVQSKEAVSLFLTTCTGTEQLQSQIINRFYLAATDRTIF